MLKTTIQIVNNTCEQIKYENGALGANVTVPAYTTVTTIVDADKADAVIAAIDAKYPASVVITDLGDHDDGEAYPYQPFILHNLAGDGAPTTGDDVQPMAILPGPSGSM